MRFENKVLFVTGGASGLGAATARRFADEGAKVAVADINEEEIVAAQVLYIEGYLWDSPSAKAACLKAISSARKAGTKVAFAMSDPFLIAATTLKSGSSSIRATSAPRTMATSSASRILSVGNSLSRG